MSIVQQMREQLRGAMKARDKVRTDFLRYWIAGLTLATGEEMADEPAIRKMRSVLKEAQTGRVTFTPEELELIKDWVPATLGRDEVRALLAPVVDQIRTAPKEGMAMGLAMKALAGKAVESDDVKAILAELRG